jgi:hypothetical protein
LLAALAPHLQRAGPPIRVVDGFEQFSWLARWRLKRRCRRMCSGILVTSHRPTGLPTLIEISPEPELVHRLVNELCAGASALITPQDVTAGYARHGSNIRELFFDLYDRHEQLRRVNRTIDPIAT